MSSIESQNTMAEIKNLNKKFRNIYFLPRYQVSYLGIASIDIELTAMAYALSISKHWTHYIILSPSDYPLLTQTQISSILGKIPQNISFIEAIVMNCEMLKSRIQKVRLDSAIAGYSDNQQKYTGYNMPSPNQLKILKGGQWKLLSRNMVEYFVWSEDGWARRMSLLFANSFIPTEHYFQTTICSSPRMNSSAKIASVTYVNWDNINWQWRTGQSKINLGPNTMDLKLLKKALDKGTLFARKFQFEGAGKTLKTLLDNLQNGEEINLLNTTYTKEIVFQNAMNYYLNAAINGTTCSQLIQNDKKQPCPQIVETTTQ